MSPAAIYQIEIGEAQRAVILAELRTSGASSPRDLCDRLGLLSGTVQRHLARLLRAGVVYVARGVTSTGRRTAYALTQEAADAAIEATTPAHRRVPAPVVVPPPPSSETRVRLPVVSPLTRGECAEWDRPCVLASCRYHLDGAESCALDVADRGPHHAGQIAELLGTSKQRVYQIESDAMRRMVRRAAGMRGEIGRGVTRNITAPDDGAD